MTASVTRQRLANLKENFAKSQELDGAIVAYASESTKAAHPYFTQDQFCVGEDAFNEAADFMAEVLGSTTGESSASSKSVADLPYRPVSRLPKLQLPTFDGRLSQWEQFRDNFKSMVFNDSTLSDVDRMQYLITCLKGDASNAISRLAITEKNFRVAWEILVKRCEHKSRLVSVHLQTLFDLPKVTVDNFINLGRLRDTANIAIESLRNLGRPVEHWDDIFVFCVTTKLSESLRKEWRLTLGESRECPSYAKLDQFLGQQINALDDSKPGAVDVNKQVSRPSVNRLNSKSTTSHTVTPSNTTCPACRSNHLLYQCDQFRNQTPSERYKLVRATNRCINCFSASHAVKDCKSTRACKQCHKRHHTMLHFQTSDAPAPPSVSLLTATDNPVEQPIEAETPSHCLTSAIARPTTVILATAYVRVYSKSGNFVQARALLDQGSAISVISENLVQLLRLSKLRRSIRIQGIGNAHTYCRHAVSLTITPHSSSAPAFPTTALVLPSLTQYKPNRVNSPCHYTHLSGLNLADKDPMSSDPIELLIGADLYGSIIRDGIRKGAGNEPVAQNTALGWIISGPVATHASSTFTSIHISHGTVHETFESELSRFWEIEEIPRTSLPSPEDIQCENHFASTHFRTPEGRYVVRLPFKDKSPTSLGTSRSSALSHLLFSERRLKRNPTQAAEYTRFLQEYESLGHMEKVTQTDEQSSPPYYIPHHGVSRTDSATTRLRVVFNASCRTSTGISLNDLLLIGPKLQTDLTSVISLWRQSQFVFTADIEKMYRQILIDPRDRDYQRILWRTNSSNQVQEYRLSTVTYGTASAPFQAQRVLQQLVEDEGSSFPLAVPVLRHQTYVDDCIFGADNIQLARQTRDQLITLLQKGGFRLRKWASNRSTLLADLDPSDHGLACAKELRSDEYLKILGITWCPESDQFKFRLSIPSHSKSTKRGLLSLIAKLFDPLGWAVPVVITAKILIQQLWKLKCDWDDPLPVEFQTQWERYRSLLHHLESAHIPRWTGQTADTVDVQLHGFSDASSVAYAAVLSLRVVSSDGSITVSLLMAKSKVAPVKTISIPRLELTAAHLLARLLDCIQQAQHKRSLPCVCWTDSTITRAWLSKPPATWKTFVANRVSEIHSLVPTGQWLHVPSEDNPADCASRGVSAPELVSHPLWWNGPLWLRLVPEFWPSQPAIAETHILEEKRTPVPILASTTVEPWDLQTRYSSWTKLLRVTAYVIRFVEAIRHKPLTSSLTGNCPKSPSADHSLHPDEIQIAKYYWYKTIQRACFPDEWTKLVAKTPVPSSSPLSKLNPYLDSSELIRIKGRLQHSNLPEPRKHPIVLRSHQLLNLIISHHHLKTMHGGPSLTLASLREELWILRARTTVRSILYRCVPCTREAAKVPTELMGDLPSMRVNPQSRAFTHTGVDYAGPILVRLSSGRGHKTHKAYISIFICMTTKAVHLELVSDYSSQAFISAFHRFIARRGLPHSMYSDNGTTFQGADRELTRAHRDAIRKSNFLNEVAANRVAWHFLPPAAPHFGGLWEAAVRSTKHHLKRCIGAHTLTSEEMATLLCRIEACLNSRPLGAISDVLDDYGVLTPGHFLIGAPIISHPEPSVLDLRENRLSRWQLVQRLSEGFWKSWSRDYLHTLQQRPKWRVVQQLAKRGQIVLLRNPNAPPAHWALGRISECHPGKDGLTRVVTIKTQMSEFKRPLEKLCFLPIEINTESQAVMAGGTPTCPDDSPSGAS
ncbi:uncharacterized protein LOC143217663 [Lasioglossum baleicum]|uniref:uncharacterized protein LOC143217663 n=1 Tax=Lasioglossum baleicum TaxID=434251 RepID=UPI003FCCD2A5